MQYTPIGFCSGCPGWPSQSGNRRPTRHRPPTGAYRDGLRRRHVDHPTDVPARINWLPDGSSVRMPHSVSGELMMRGLMADLDEELPVWPAQRRDAMVLLPAGNYETCVRTG
ncbi:hypothetical protein JCM4814A_85640 [Streptomyces phaeofaciens JCM 4814]|uniref:Uncharacterized protein n=1 Tax=Streptomyces phaeofaciens TaxID=68254 RepID=A0A918H8I5_9ACTN|nr:hypothetical protein GCM10010226_21220 [Streptomyces phaeofaciens]